MKVANESRPQKKLYMYLCNNHSRRQNIVFGKINYICTKKKWKFYFQNKILITVVTYQTVKLTTIP